MIFRSVGLFCIHLHSCTLKYGFCKKSLRKDAPLTSWTLFSSQKGTCNIIIYYRYDGELKKKTCPENNWSSWLNLYFLTVKNWRSVHHGRENKLRLIWKPPYLAIWKCYETFLEDCALDFLHYKFCNHQQPVTMDKPLLELFHYNW